MANVQQTFLSFVVTSDATAKDLLSAVRDRLGFKNDSEEFVLVETREGKGDFARIYDRLVQRTRWIAWTIKLATYVDFAIPVHLYKLELPCMQGCTMYRQASVKTASNL